MCQTCDGGYGGDVAVVQAVRSQMVDARPGGRAVTVIVLFSLLCLVIVIAAIIEQL